MTKKSAILQGLCFVLLSMLGALFLVQATISSYSADEIVILKETFGGFSILYIASMLEAGGITLLAWLIGVKMSKTAKVDLKISKPKWRDVGSVVLIGVCLSVLVEIISMFVLKTPTVDLDGWTIGYLVVYTGVVEEIWYRGCICTVCFWVFNRLFKNYSETKPKLIRICAIVFSILFVSALQSSVLAHSVPVSTFLISFVFPTVVYSYVYERRGIMYSILCHVVARVVGLCVLVPLLGLL